MGAVTGGEVHAMGLKFDWQQKPDVWFTVNGRLKGIVWFREDGPDTHYVSEVFKDGECAGTNTDCIMLEQAKGWVETIIEKLS